MQTDCISYDKAEDGTGIIGQTDSDNLAESHPDKPADSVTGTCRTDQRAKIIYEMSWADTGPGRKSLHQFQCLEPKKHYQTPEGTVIKL